VSEPPDWPPRGRLTLAEYWTTGPGSVSLTPDPRISNLRPAWLADDDEWRGQLQAMSYDDAMWIERQWELAGGAGPVDASLAARLRSTFDTSGRRP
jgi:hypothetical protein